MTKKAPTKEIELKIEYVDIDSLLPYVNNAKIHEEEDISFTAASIKEFGMNAPIAVWKDNVIIYGHGRTLACKKLNMKKVPVVRLDHLTNAQRKAYCLADNKSTMKTGFNSEMLKIELESLKEMDFNLDLTGFTIDDLADLDLEINSPKEETERDDGNYTKKIIAPIYEPKGDKPTIEELFDIEKTKKLIKEIDESDIDEQEKKFLRLASYRHIVFNYENIAEYYSHSEKQLQNLMENSALVIIDFNKAIENGFVKLSEEIAEAYKNEAK